MSTRKSRSTLFLLFGCFLMLLLSGCNSSISAHAASLSLLANTANAAAPSSCNWRVVSSPNPSSQNYNNLTAIASILEKDIWAVGTSYKAGIADHAIIEHWNGTHWKLVSNQRAGSSLNSVVAIKANNVWAVGSLSGQT